MNTGIVPFALVLRYVNWIDADEMRTQIEKMKELIAAYDGTAECIPIVIFRDNPGLRTAMKIFAVPNDADFLWRMLDGLRELNVAEEPKEMTFEANFDLDVGKKVKIARRASTKSDPVPLPPPVETIRPSLRFMYADGFKTEAEEFYRELRYVTPANHGTWVKRRFVDELEHSWPQIARADRAIGGLISDALSVVAATPHFPPWWRSIGVCLSRGHAHSIEKTCRDVIEYTGPIKPMKDVEVVDRFAARASGTTWTLHP